jgi:hypothetical protein
VLVVPVLLPPGEAAGGLEEGDLEPGTFLPRAGTRLVTVTMLGLCRGSFRGVFRGCLVSCFRSLNKACGDGWGVEEGERGSVKLGEMYGTQLADVGCCGAPGGHSQVKCVSG